MRCLHVVPLPAQAVAILEKMNPRRGGARTGARVAVPAPTGVERKHAGPCTCMRGCKGRQMMQACAHERDAMRKGANVVALGAA